MPQPFGADAAPLPSAPFSFPLEPDDAPQLVRLAFQLANRAVISDIESEGHKVQLDGRIWWDTRPMTDLREHSPEVVDMATAAIQYAVGSGIAAIHPQRPYLLTITPR